MTNHRILNFCQYVLLIWQQVLCAASQTLSTHCFLPPVISRTKLYLIGPNQSHDLNSIAIEVSTQLSSLGGISLLKT